MNDVLLQTIIEKLKTLEAVILERKVGVKVEQPEDLRDSLQVLRRDMMKVVNNQQLGLAKMDRFSSMEKLNADLVRTKKKYKNWLVKSLMVCAVLFVLSIGFLWGWVDSNDAREKMEANDFKYRFLKASGDKEVLRMVFEVDSLYGVDGVDFERMVADGFNSESEKVGGAGERKKK